MLRVFGVRGRTIRAVRIPPMALEPGDLVPAAPPGDGPGWVAEAACAGASTERWFEGPTAGAVAVCRTCPVASRCLDYALTERLTDGVWGGLDGDDRREVAKARGIVWETEARPRRECACGRWARPSRTMCAACQQRAYRASRR